MPIGNCISHIRIYFFISKFFSPYSALPLRILKIGWMEKHQAAVASIAAQVQQFFHRNEPFRIYHGSTNSTRPSQFQHGRVIDTSGLNHVLKVDVQAKAALVEPNVPMDSLVAETIRHGLVPPVVMEFPGITVGGGFAGTAGESSSFRYGFFDRTINWIEMILADGSVVTASSIDRSDLFYSAACSFGTLGVTSLLEVRLIEAKKFVELTYHPISGILDARQKIEQATNDLSNDYVDGILFAKNSGVICLGRLTNDGNARVQRFSRAKDPWFYLHADEIFKRNSKSPTTELVPLVDYLFRYDRGGFWVGKYAFRYFVTPFNRITRWILDDLLHTRVMYHGLHKSGHSKRLIIQDVAMPYRAADEFAQYLDASFGLYPIWLCPFHQTGPDPNSPYGLLAEKATRDAPQMLLNFGVWGPGPKGRREFIAANRHLEHKVQELGGKKWLYAHVYCSEEEFWGTYNRNEYDAARAKYHATYLPSIYDKVKVDFKSEEQAIGESWIVWLMAIFWRIWPLSGLYGLFQAIFSSDYLLPKNT